jgi:hypothetical protein
MIEDLQRINVSAWVEDNDKLKRIFKDKVGGTMSVLDAVGLIEIQTQCLQENHTPATTLMTAIRSNVISAVI